MVKANKKVVLLLALVFVTLVSLNFVSAAYAGEINNAQNLYINRTIETRMNISITAAANDSHGNITLVNITLPSTLTFVTATNLTTLSNANFSNWSNGGNNNIQWNTTGIFGNDTTHNFVFNVTSQIAGSAGNIIVNTTRTDGEGNFSIFSIVVNFAFAGYIKNDSGGIINGTNVSMYQYVMGANSPPTETLESQILVSNATTGYFDFQSLNGSATFYLLKSVHYNGTGGGAATLTSAILPAFPASLYYPASSAFDIALNGSTFYLQPAATLRLYAWSFNATNAEGNANTPFGYEVIDQKVGFPVTSNILANITTVDVVVPSGRDYSVMFVRDFSKFTSGAFCNGTFHNQTHCPSPPLTNSTLGTINPGNTIVINQSLAVTKYNLYGCINVMNNIYNKSNYNNVTVTNIKLKMIPFSTSKGNFIPPMDADQGNINVSNFLQLNNTNVTSGVMCPNSDTQIAAYNISVLGSSGGIKYLVEVYAKNGTRENVTATPGVYFAAFQNVSITGSRNLNLTLYPLAGIQVNNSNSLNTSQMRINIINATGGAVVTSMHVEVSVKNSAAGVGTTGYMIESLTNGTFYLPILNNSDWARVSVFANDAPPMSKTLNLSMPNQNITLVSISPVGGDKGLRQMNSTGGLSVVNATGMPFDLTFYRLGTNEIITNMSASNFNPLKALVAGSVDLEIKMRATNISMRFKNFDMFSAKQPPMFAIIDNNTLTSSASQIWTFGNFVPKDVYDNVTITLPYDNSTTNESWSYKMNISILYEEDPNNDHQFKPAWNISAGDTVNTLSDYFSEYNNSRYRDYLTGAGTTCNTNVTSGAICIMNQTSEEFIMELPHFSGLSPGIAGTAPASAAAAAAATTSSGGTTAVAWTSSHKINEEQFKAGYTKELRVKHRIIFTINKEDHHVGVKELTDTTAKIEVSSASQEATLAIGDVRKFEVTNDTFYDVQVTLNSIASSKASITIKEIHEKITPETVAEEEKKEKEAKAEEEEIIETEISLLWLWILIIVAVVIIAAIIIWSAIKKRR